MQLFDHVLRSKTTTPPPPGDNRGNWIAYFKLKPTHGATLPLLLLLHLCLEDDVKCSRGWEEADKTKRMTGVKEGRGLREGANQGQVQYGDRRLYKQGWGSRLWHHRGSPGNKMSIRIFCPTVSKTNRSQSFQGYSPPAARPGGGGPFCSLCSVPTAWVHPGTQLWLLCAGGGQAKAPKLMPIPMPTP